MLVYMYVYRCIYFTIALFTGLIPVQGLMCNMCGCHKVVVVYSLFAVNPVVCRVLSRVLAL